MDSKSLLALADAQEFRKLFIDELGWSNPDQQNLNFVIDGSDYSFDQVAGYKGLRVWLCRSVPDPKTQRVLDQMLSESNIERLLIFANATEQAWRWPRRRKLGAANAKLVLHSRKVGAEDPRLGRQLEAIVIDFDEQPTLVELLDRVRQAFDFEAEATSAQAARLMGALYTELESTGWAEEDATLFLARLLFLFFGDDSGMWNEGQFQDLVANHTTIESFASVIEQLFEAVDQPEGKRADYLPEPVRAFRYINGGLFSDRLNMGNISSTFREHVLAAGDFDWSYISPAVFGSMFQTVKDKKARHAGGEHYTTEESILKTIEPLFLTEYRERFEKARDDRGQLTKLHNDLGRLQVMDPACGCGNFLIVAYRELRALELEILLRQRELDLTNKGRFAIQQSFDVTEYNKVTLNHFHGIEIEEWPARIAETAMLLVDHLANQRMESDFGIAPDRLPIQIAPNIVHGNAIRTDWACVVKPSEDVIIVGNPPFLGQYGKSAEQTADTKHAWGANYNGYLDYVTCWYALAVKYFGELPGRWAFVSTNSVSQGEATEFLWRPILNAGWRCRFAHRSFQWLTEAPGGAAVHVSIIGFDKKKNPRPALYEYEEGGKGAGVVREVNNINPYLVAQPNVLVSSKTKPGSAELKDVSKGSQPTDGGHLLLDEVSIVEAHQDLTACKYVRPFIGARELINGGDRWCLWLEGVDQKEIANSEFLAERVNNVREFRLKSPKAATRAKATTPHLFDERRHPGVPYLAIPRVVSELRPYLTVARLDANVISSDALFTAEDEDGVLYGILSSTMFIIWLRAIGGRLKSDLRFSNTFVFNTFPLPAISAEQRQRLIDAAMELQAVRASHEDLSLAKMYRPGLIPTNVQVAHDHIDEVIDSVFKVPAGADLDTRQGILFKRYAALTNQTVEPSLFELDLV